MTHSYAAQSTSSKGKFVPRDDKVLLILGQDRESIKNYIDEVGIVPAGFTVYTSIQKLDGLDRPANYGAGIQHANYMLKEYPYGVIQLGLYMVGALDGTLEGRYDQNIKKLGRWLKKTKRPVFLRIGYEFDNPDNGYEPEKYIQAYRYIVDFLNKMKVENAAYVWHSQAGLPQYPHKAWYPGDNYVDWVAISYFSPYNEANMDKVANIAARHNKPFMIAEATPIKLKTSEGNSTWDRWFDFVFNYINKRNVKAFCYINTHWDAAPMFVKDQWGDSRIEENRYILRQWRKKIKEKQFLNYSKLLSRKLQRE